MQGSWGSDCYRARCTDCSMTHRLAWPADDRHPTALLVIYIRIFVKSRIWVENRQQTTGP
jgi:hypothetical protein